MPVKTDYAGRTFGRITLHERVPEKPGYWRGECSCGNLVEKRIDNLKRPGNHSCGKCPVTIPVPPPVVQALQRRVDELEALVKQEVLPKVIQLDTQAPGPRNKPQASKYFGVTHDGEFFVATPLPRKTVFWGDSEAEAAYAVRYYLEKKNFPGYPRISDEDAAAIPDSRRQEIEAEVDERL